MAAHHILPPESIELAVLPALEPARARVCDCASRLPTPKSIDLIIKTTPDEGRATVIATERSDDFDWKLGPALVRCFDVVNASYNRWHLGTDTNPVDGHSTIAYPLHVNLARAK